MPDREEYSEDTRTAYSPEGDLIVSTLEKLQARSGVVASSFTQSEDGSLDFDHTGTSEYDWHTASHVERDGERVFVAEDGSLWTASELVLEA